MISPVLQGAGQVFQSGLAADLAGNVNAIDVRLNVDVTPPGVKFDAPTPAPNSAGWNNTTVTISFTPEDSLSGVASTSVPSPLSLTAEGSSVHGSVTVSDFAGNTATFNSASVKIDKTAPILHVTSPVSGTILNTQIVSISGTVTDDNSGGGEVSGVGEVSCTVSGSAVSTSASVGGSNFVCSSIQLLPGANNIFISAKDRADNPNIVLLTIHYLF